MTEYLVLRMTSEPDQAGMVVVNDEGQLLAGPEQVALTSVREHAHDRDVVVLLPAREFVSCLADVPAVSPAKLRQMLPYSLEDEFAADIEDLHFVAGERNDAGALPVTVISRSRLRFWLTALKASDIVPRRLQSEADAVADTPGTTTVCLEGKTILGRRPGHAPFMFDEMTLDEVWQLLEGERDDRQDLDRVVVFADPATRVQREAEIEAWRGRISDLEIKELPEGCLPRFAARVVTQPGPNLLQGEFGARSDFAALWKPWRAAAAFLVALIAFSLVGKAAVVWKLNQDDVALENTAAEICASSYSSAQLASCEGEMLRRLAATSSDAGGRGDFLQILSIIGAAADAALQIQNIGYRDGAMVIEVIVPGIPSLEAFVQAVSGAGPYSAVPGTTRSVDSGYQARVEIARP